MIETDELDESIIALLQKDGRTSNREIGRILDVSEGTVRKRLKRLYDLNAFRLTVLKDIRVVDLTTSAYVRLSVAPAHAHSVAQFISELPSCAYAAFSAGRYNVLSFLVAKDRMTLALVVDSEIAVLKGVREIDVREVVYATKHRFDLVLIKPVG